MVEKFYWADQAAEKIIKAKGNKIKYVCASGITPSGTVHIGNFREVITTELVVRALKDKGKKVRFIYSWDDYDRFRKVPSNLSKEYEKYIGMPLSEVPSPFNKKKSYAKYFEEQFEKSLKKVGIKPEFINQHLMNKACKYSSLIKTAIDKRKEIMEVLNKYRKEPLKENWYPIIIYCQKCKKDLTEIINVEDYVIEYSCDCGYVGKFDFRKKGLAKLRWRADWPARWKYEKVDFEPGGIDHSAAGSSFETGKEIVRRIFDYEPPIYTFYEWVRLKGGKEFSSSTGNVISLDDVEAVYEPEILRYIFVGTRPKKGFQISFDNEIIKIYQEYDELENLYYEGKPNLQEKRIYELSQVTKVKKEKPEKTSFRHLITLVQIGKTKSLNKEDKLRAEKVKNWLKDYAGEDMVFKLQTKISRELTDPERQSMILLKEILATKKYSADKLFSEFYNICGTLEIEPKDFFQTAYEIILGKSKGPRLADLIIEIGQDKIVKLLNKIK